MLNVLNLRNAQIRRRGTVAGASAAALVAGLASSAFAPVPVDVAPDTRTVAEQTQDTAAHWQRVSFEDQIVGEVSFALPPGYSLETVQQNEYRTHVDVLDPTGRVVLTFDAAAPIVGEGIIPGPDARYGDVTVLRSAPIDIPSVNVDAQSTEPMIQYVAIGDERGVNAGISLTNREITETEDVYAQFRFVNALPFSDEEFFAHQSARYSFGDSRILTLGSKDGSTGDDFANLAEANEYQHTQEFRDKWAIVNSLQIDQSSILK